MMQENPKLQIAATSLVRAGRKDRTAKTKNPVIRSAQLENCVDIQKQIAQIRADFGLPKNSDADKRLAKARAEDLPALKWAPKVVT